jgi:F0F1-type ATP synthase assembly protein I
MTGQSGANGGGPHPGKPGQHPISGVEFAGAGVQFAVILVLSAWAGTWADRQLGTSPWLTIVAVFAGAALAFYSLYHKLMKGQRLGDRRKHRERRDVE